VSWVRLDLAHERPVAPTCRVTIRTLERVAVWSQGLACVAGDAAVAITVPATVLVASQYEVVLESVLAGRAPRVEAVYSLNVARSR
jgi:hypothetical protein